MARKPHRRRRHGQDELTARLRVAHKSASDMSKYAGELLQGIEALRREVYSRDLLIEQLKEQLADSETMYARAMKD